MPAQVNPLSNHDEIMTYFLFRINLKWTQVNPSEPKWTEVNRSEPKWTHDQIMMKSWRTFSSELFWSEPTWTQVKPTEPKWSKVNPWSNHDEIKPSQAKQSNAKPSQAKPSKAKPSQTMPRPLLVSLVPSLFLRAFGCYRNPFTL